MPRVRTSRVEMILQISNNSENTHLLLCCIVELLHCKELSSVYIFMLNQHTLTNTISPEHNPEHLLVQGQQQKHQKSYEICSKTTTKTPEQRHDVVLV